MYLIVGFRLKNNLSAISNGISTKRSLDFIHRRSGQCNRTSVFICILSILVINDNDTVPMTLWPWLPLPCAAAPKRSCSTTTPIWLTCEMKSRNRRNSILYCFNTDRFAENKKKREKIAEKCSRAIASHDWQI